MCTWIMKVRGDTVLKLSGIHCCMRVEDVKEFAPDISRANGWQEVFVDGNRSRGGRSVTKPVSLPAV